MIEWIGKTKDFMGHLAIRVKRGTVPDHYTKVFDNPSGKIVLADIVRKAGVMLTHEGHNDSEIQYATGRRDLALYIAAMLRLKPADMQHLSEMRTLDD